MRTTFWIGCGLALLLAAPRFLPAEDEAGEKEESRKDDPVGEREVQKALEKAKREDAEREQRARAESENAQKREKKEAAEQERRARAEAESAERKAKKEAAEQERHAREHAEAIEKLTRQIHENVQKEVEKRTGKIRAMAEEIERAARQMENFHREGKIEEAEIAQKALLSLQEGITKAGKEFEKSLLDLKKKSGEKLKEKALELKQKGPQKGDEKMLELKRKGLEKPGQGQSFDKREAGIEEQLKLLHANRDKGGSKEDAEKLERELAALKSLLKAQLLDKPRPDEGRGREIEGERDGGRGERAPRGRAQPREAPVPPGPPAREGEIQALRREMDELRRQVSRMGRLLEELEEARADRRGRRDPRVEDDDEDEHEHRNKNDDDEDDDDDDDHDAKERPKKEARPKPVPDPKGSPKPVERQREV